MVHQQRKDPLEGATVDGRYVVQSRLARGGMSTVYLATDRRLDRRVALKVLYPHLADEPGFVDRFEQEAKSAARLSHPRVVGVLDQGVDTIGGQAVAYLVMEYVPGRTLRDVLREHGRLPPRRALDLLDAVVEGLAAAHEAGLIHRDVKPENVLLSDGGQVKIADFGLARAVSATTGTATLVGTAAYLSPELVLGRPAEAQSDIYSTGVLLFELLTGHQPFTGETPIQVAIQHAQSEVPAPSVLLPGLAPDIDELVQWCTSRDPEDRPVDGSALLGELRHIRQTLTDEELDFAPAAAPSPALHQDQLTATVVPRLPDDGRTEALSRRDLGGDDAASPPGSTDVLPLAAHDNATSVIRRDSNSTRVFGAVPAVPPMPSSPPAASGTGAFAGGIPRRTAEGTRLGSSVDEEGFDEDGVYEEGFDEDGFDEDGFDDGPGEGGPADEQHRHGSAASTGARPTGGRTGSTVRPPSRRQQARQAQRPQNTLHGRTARRSVRLLVVLLVLLAGLAAAAGWFFGAGPGGVVSLPDVADVPLATARAALDEEGIASLSTEEVFDENVLPGLVIGTDPAASSEIRRFERVHVIVSKGPELFRVPDLLGGTQITAAAELGAAGFAVGTIEEQYDESVAAGIIVRQVPEQGAERRRGSAVDLVVSLGPEPVAVPDVTGLPEQEAVAAVEQAGLEAVLDDAAEYSRTVPAGAVLGQSPSGEVQRGTRITLTLSKGPRMVRVPNVFSLPEGRAVAALEAAGFTVQVDYTFGSAVLGLVAGQSPTGDQPEGTTIRITVT
ncbi:Stk1 family PASTA domain-containing Ser/Thr kinase [Arthrobacter burdickii]|uniref:non-specific serine/threonine protein kinase n=1 Tax=Arthrobacter burdickii TaxID=3035920 RepID=A0ABT8K3P4_9MICC|nr:Stk1 family PASTA domain-containing Ser/Thr kinase [Arthrobacter burdickii]MDN4612068.1 PASTA domain-containing protein [Arthrobacter burdickii]